MAIDDKIKALNKQLYPTGRVWRINPNSIKEKFVDGLLASEIRAYNDAVSILDSTIPDNANFTVDDASAWEKRLGLVDGTGTSLQSRIDAIKVQLNWPGTNPAKGAADYIQSVLQAAGYNVCVHENIFTAYTLGSWISETASESNQWTSVAYGNGIFVAVASSGTHKVMTSSDGITWTARSASEGNQWLSICYGNGLFVATAFNGTHRVMTSPDGITWTNRTASSAHNWNSVCYGNGLFVAVSSSATVMTSPDGITWTDRSGTAANVWSCVCYGNGLFVAVSRTGVANCVMTSPDGITWTGRTYPEDNQWYSVCYGNGIFVAVSSNGTHKVMTSPDGITWTARTEIGGGHGWYSVCYGIGFFVAVGQSGGNPVVMTSPDGITWTGSNAPETNLWQSVIYGNNVFVAVGTTGTHQVMISNVTAIVSTETYAQFAGINLVRHISTLLHGQQKHGYLSKVGIIVANSVDPVVDASFNLGDYSDTIFIGGCPPGTFVNIPKAQETAFRQLILKIKPVNITVLLLVNYV